MNYETDVLEEFSGNDAEVQQQAEKVEAGDLRRNKGRDDEVARLKKLLAQETIKTELILAGVAPDKVNKALRLFDAESMSVDGMLDRQELELEIEEVLGDFPELLVKGTAKSGFGFKIGADIAQNKQNNEKIASVFGNV